MKAGLVKMKSYSDPGFSGRARAHGRGHGQALGAGGETRQRDGIHRQKAARGSIHRGPEAVLDEGRLACEAVHARWCIAPCVRTFYHAVRRIPRLREPVARLARIVQAARTESPCPPPHFAMLFSSGS